MYETIPEFLSSVGNKYPTKYALYIRRFLRTTRFTYRELEQVSFKIANYLLENGVKPCDKVLIWAPNMPEWVLALFGCLSAGIVVVPVGLHSTSEVVEKYIDQTKPNILFLSKFYPIDLKKSEKIKKIYLEELVELVENIEPKKLPKINKNELAEIVFTSGTTGEPKGVMISHHNILFEIEQLMKTVPHYKHYRLLSVLPLSHVMEQIIGLMVPLTRGGTTYYIPRINTVTIKKALQKFQITDLGVVPQMLRMFLDTVEYQVAEQKETPLFNAALKITPFLPIFVRRFVFSKIHESLGGKLYVFGVGSAPLDIKLAQTWEAMGVKVVEGYGLSETTGAITANRINKRNLGSVGKKIKGMDIKLSPENEVLVRADNVTKGYFENEEKTKDAFTLDGYFKTGDVGYFKDGYLYITGREKFKIVTAAGDKIYPEDIEKKLNAHPDVWDSCVMGIKKNDGEIVYAVVILKTKTSLEKIISDVNKNLEVNQQIMGSSVWSQKDFPRLHTLKVDRNKVKELIEKQLTGEKIEMDTATESGDKLIEILSKVCKIPQNKIKETTNLVTDLGLDSLKRVELVSLIEEEFDAEIDETTIDAKISVEKLRKEINNLSPEKRIKPHFDLDKIRRDYKKYIFRKVKVLFQEFLIFPYFRFCLHISVNGLTNLDKNLNSCVFVTNHPGEGDVISILSILPRKVREKTVELADDLRWTPWWWLFKHEFITNIFGMVPIDKVGGSMGNSLETAVDFIDDGFNVLFAPEGRFTPPTEKLASLGPGVAKLFSNTKINFIPFWVTGKFHQQEEARVSDASKVWFYYFTNLKITIGKPFNLYGLKEEQSMKVIRSKILELNEKDTKNVG